MAAPTNIIRLSFKFILRLIKNSPLISLIVGLLVYVALDGVWNYLTLLSYRVMVLTVIVVLLAVWLVVRLRHRWRWHRTALDGVVGLWLLAFAVSLLANLDLWRRISLGLWFCGLYILLWYVMHDGMTSGVLKREALVDGVLAAGGVILVAGYLDIYRWYHYQLAGLPRISARMEEPNSAGTIALILIALAVARCFSSRGIVRIFSGLYALLAVGLLVCTGSRGAWIAGGAALALMVVLLVWHYRGNVSRLVWAGMAVVALIGVLGVTVGRGWALESRPVIYQSAVKIFEEKPITGYGLFTFGREFIRVYGVIPDETAHSHAHNFVLNVAAELGLVGLIALFATLAALFLAVRRNWRIAAELNLPQERLLIIGATVACIGFGVHHLFDMTAMKPAVAIVGLVALVVAVAPLKPIPVRRPRLALALIGGLSAILLIAGACDTAVFSVYAAGIKDANANRIPQAIQRLQLAENMDPAMPVTLVNLAFVQYVDGQMDAARQTVARLCQLDPYFAPYPYTDQESILQFVRPSLVTTSEFWDTYSCR